MDLFSNSQNSHLSPLADRLRPQSFDELVGQKKIFSDNRQLIQLLKSGHLQSLILWGPPGCGKTSFAKSLINEVSATCYEENAIDLGAKKIRELGEKAKQNLLEQQQKTIVFIDEIHRLNRGQQDVLLPFIEKGFFYLVGATTENPSYQLNSALMSRCRLLVFEPLEPGSLKDLLERVFEKEGKKKGEILQDEAEQYILQACHGDARKLLNILEE